MWAAPVQKRLLGGSGVRWCESSCEGLEVFECGKTLENPLSRVYCVMIIIILTAVCVSYN